MKVDNFLDECIEEYNRKTIDYGNGQVEIVAHNSPQLRFIGTNHKSGNNSKSIISDEEQARRSKQQMHAIRRRIKGIALCNNFNWFVTLTLNPEIVNSTDYDTVKTLLLKWIRLMRDRYGKFDYLLIPEFHKDRKKIHFHGLLNIEANFIKAKHKKTDKPIIRHGRPVYNLSDWGFGFSDCEMIVDKKKTVSYICKYISKELINHKEMFRKKRYFNSQNLKRPKVEFSMNDNDELKIFTPNYGVISTTDDGQNLIDVGIYNLTRNNKTGELSQEDKNYLLKAKRDNQPDKNK